MNEVSILGSGKISSRCIKNKKFGIKQESIICRVKYLTICVIQNQQIDI